MKKNEEKYAAVERPEQTSLKVGLATIKIQGMAAKPRATIHSLSTCLYLFALTLLTTRIHNYDFNWDRMTSFEGDTCPYLQYAHVRLTALTQKNPELLPLPALEQIVAETLAEQPAPREIVFLLGAYPYVLRTALRTHELSGVVMFCVSARACDFERVGDGCGEGRGGLSRLERT